MNKQEPTAKNTLIKQSEIEAEVSQIPLRGLLVGANLENLVFTCSIEIMNFLFYFFRCFYFCYVKL